MAKEKKITVKHFLRKNLGKKYVNRIFYPLYVRHIFERKRTDLRSKYFNFYSVPLGEEPPEKDIFYHLPEEINLLEKEDFKSQPEKAFFNAVLLEKLYHTKIIKHFADNGINILTGNPSEVFDTLTQRLLFSISVYLINKFEKDIHSFYPGLPEIIHLNKEPFNSSDNLTRYIKISQNIFNDRILGDYIDKYKNYLKSIEAFLDYFERDIFRYFKIRLFDWPEVKDKIKPKTKELEEFIELADEVYNFSMARFKV